MKLNEAAERFIVNHPALTVGGPRLNNNDLEQAFCDGARWAFEEAAKDAEAVFVDPNWHVDFKHSAKLIAHRIRKLSGGEG